MTPEAPANSHGEFSNVTVPWGSRAWLGVAIPLACALAITASTDLPPELTTQTKRSATEAKGTRSTLPVTRAVAPDPETLRLPSAIVAGPSEGCPPAAEIRR